MAKKVGSPSPTRIMRLIKSINFADDTISDHFVEHFNKVHTGQRLIITTKIPVGGI